MQAVSHAADSVNQLSVKGFIDFRSQSAEVCLNNIRLGVEMKLPNMFQQHRMSHHAVGIAHQIFEQTELPRKQLDGPPAAHYPATDQVHLKISYPEHRHFIGEWRPARQCVC